MGLILSLSGHGGKGIGSLLYSRLIDHLRDEDFHVLIGTIALPNESSVKFHEEKFGFTKVAHLSEVGWKFKRWHDVGMWQLKL